VSDLPLRGVEAPHDPDAACVVQTCAALAVPLVSRVAPDREIRGSRDMRCPEPCGSGQSLQREQSRWGEPRYGVLGPCPGEALAVERLERQLSMGRCSSPDHLSVVRGVRVVRGRARGNIHLQKSQVRTRP